MSRHLTAIRGGLVDDPTIDPTYWQHPVHASKFEAKRLAVLGAHFATDNGEVPYMARWAADVIVLAVQGNPKAVKRAPEALEVLGAYFSKPADDDSCNPHGMTRPSA